MLSNKYPPENVLKMLDNGKSKLLTQNRERFSLLGLKLVVE
jgi:hypothetical protein